MAYPETRKIALVREYEQGKSVADISANSGVPANSIYRWIHEYKTIRTETKEFTPNDFYKLQVHSTKQDHVLEVIRLSGCISAIPQKKKLAILETIYDSHSEYSVHEICEALEVDRGTFYNHIFRRVDPSKKENREKELMQTVQQVYSDSGQRYGADRITKVLKANGVNINKQHVLDIMHELGLESVRQGAKRTYQQKREKTANKLRRDFSADRPNKVWVSDITHYKCGDRHFFICAIIDLFSRKVIAYRIAEHESKQLVNTTIKDAIANRHPPKGLIFHSDRGGQYMSKSLLKILSENDITQSLSTAGKPYDNAVAESFFSTLKKEELYRHDYKSINEFRCSVGKYIDFYNQVRAHSYLRFMSPEKYERKCVQQNDNG